MLHQVNEYDCGLDGDDDFSLNLSSNIPSKPRTTIAKKKMVTKKEDKSSKVEKATTRGKAVKSSSDRGRADEGEEMSTVKENKPPANLTSTVDPNGNKVVPFSEFDVLPDTVSSLIESDIHGLFPIQAATFPALRSGKDLIGRARTGQGKTLAFCLPISELLLRSKEPTMKQPRALIMTPTRELAKQILTVFSNITKHSSLRSVSLYGGTDLQTDYKLLKQGVDVVIGTPGRIKDLVDKKWLILDEIKHFILDEADQMLDMGFQDELQFIMDAFKGPRQMCLFSATMPKWVHTIASQYMSVDRVLVDLVGDSVEKAGVTIRHIAIPTHWTMIGETINAAIAMFTGRNGKILIFCQTKLDCDTLAMDKTIKHECHVLHGDIPQAKRESTLQAFQGGSFRVLIATDVAARGLDMIVDLVIQAKPPMRMNGKSDSETYVHRSGRTGRAGRKGICVTLWTPKVKSALEDIERIVGNSFEWMPTPQPSDVLIHSTEQRIEEICEVDKKMFPYFSSAATALIEKMGAHDALCAMLSTLTGVTEVPPSRSLLTSTDGMVTLQLNSVNPIKFHGYIYSLMSKHFPNDLNQSIRGVRLTKDGLAACFDVSEKYMDLINKFLDGVTGYKWLEICDKLPSLQEDKKKETPGRQSAGKRGGIKSSNTPTRMKRPAEGDRNGFSKRKR